MVGRILYRMPSHQSNTYRRKHFALHLRLGSLTFGHQAHRAEDRSNVLATLSGQLPDHSVESKNSMTRRGGWTHGPMRDEMDEMTFPLVPRPVRGA